MPFPRSLGLVGLLFAATALAQNQDAAQPAVQPAPVPPAEQPSPDPTPAPSDIEQPRSGQERHAEGGSPAVAQPLPEEAAAPMVALDDPDAPVNPGDASAGQAIAAVCAACHGADGNSVDPQYPKLAGMPERYIARQLALYKSGERPDPIMMGFAAQLSAQDMRDVGAYFASQKVLPGLADDTPLADGPNEGQPFYAVGEAIYRGGDRDRGIPACMACHGPAGEGNPGPAYPALAGQHAGYTVAQLQHFRSGQGWGEGANANVVMPAIAANLSDEEIQALATYIEGLHAVAEQAPAN
ncbi:c-type cytochrome [Coralloluteibacterium thermophilus]|uniref:C-type cytochrome n=1 Tax=Coralloluteibacterium thermophilum TaxID=2707049 RepID=A0ABV9NMD0_9GAMM